MMLYGCIKGFGHKAWNCILRHVLSRADKGGNQSLFRTLGRRTYGVKVEGHPI